MLKGWKDIAAKLRDVWGIDVGQISPPRWSKLDVDPLPVRRVNPTGKKASVIADPVDVEAWARRQVT